MTIQDAFDRTEMVHASSLMEGDIAVIGAGQVPKEIAEITKVGQHLTFRFVDDTTRVAYHAEQVLLCME